MDKVGGLFAGVASIAAGIGIMYKPRYIYPVFGGGIVDLTGYNIPFGFAWIVIGAISTWVAVAPKRDK